MSYSEYNLAVYRMPQCYLYIYQNITSYEPTIDKALISASFLSRLELKSLAVHMSELVPILEWSLVLQP